MQSWKQLVDICSLDIPNVFHGVFYESLTKLAEPDFAGQVPCIDAEQSYTTTASDPNYELPVGLVSIKVVAFKGRPLTAMSLANLLPGERYHSDGTTLRTGTPYGYYVENDQLTLIPAPSSASNLRVNYFSLPTYGVKKFLALADSSATVIYLDLAIGDDLATDTVTLTNNTRSLSANISAYALIDDLRHKYTVSITAQAAGDEVQMALGKYLPTIPEKYAPLLIPYAKAKGYASLENTKLHDYWMAEYEKGRDKAKIDEASKAFPQAASFDHARVIR